MLTEEQEKDLREYIAQSIEDFDIRVGLAYNKIDRWRCPLSHADEELYYDIESAANDWCMDNDMGDIYDHIDDLEELL